MRIACVLVLFLSTLSVAQKKDTLEAALDTATNAHRAHVLNELFREYISAEPLKAMDYAREALRYATEVGDKKGLAAAYNNLGVAYRMQGALDKSLEYYINSLRTYQELGNAEGIAGTKGNIATLYAIKKDYGQAMKYLEESHAFLRDSGDSVKLIGSLNNLGNLYTDMQLYEKAEQYYGQALTLAQKRGVHFADPLTNTGNIYFRLKNYQRAAEMYQKALAIERAAGNKTGVLNVLTNLAIVFVEAKQPKPAQAYLDEAFPLCEELKAYSLHPSLFRAQAGAYALEGNFRDAWLTQLKYDEAREKVFGEESSRKIAQMELRLSSQERDRELEALQREDAIKTLELRQTRLVIFSAVLALFVVLAFLNYFYLGKRKSVRKKTAAG